jgi:DUF438 domain-containing protein
MVKETYIGETKSEKFDFDIPRHELYNLGYAPDPIMYVCDDLYKIFWDIVSDVLDKKENTKQTDWGCWVIKMNKNDLIEYLSQTKYNPEIPSLSDNESYQKFRAKYEHFLNSLKELDPEQEYLLVAKEIM